MKRLLKQSFCFVPSIVLEVYPYEGYTGASEELIKIAGYYVDRMSVNLELPTNAALKSWHRLRQEIIYLSL